MTVTIYHNPACGTSRNVLAMIRNSGRSPTVIEYLDDPAVAREQLVRPHPRAWTSRSATCFAARTRHTTISDWATQT